MKIETSVKVLEKERNWLGVSMKYLLLDIEKNGKMVYSERVVEAFQIYRLVMFNGRKVSEVVSAN